VVWSSCSSEEAGTQGRLSIFCEVQVDVLSSHIDMKKTPAYTTPSTKTVVEQEVSVFIYNDTGLPLQGLKESVDLEY